MKLERKHPVHGIVATSSAPVLVFLTVCTRKRQPWLATPEVHQMLRAAWAGEQPWAVGRYVVLPDHIHMFVAPVLGRPLEPWVTFWKRSVTRAHGNPAWRWQTDHWDRRLRREESNAQKWQYVALNPVRHGLVKRPEDWPYQGELNTLAWWG